VYGSVVFLSAELFYFVIIITMIWAKTFTFSASWPTTVLFVLVHGNEIVGKYLSRYVVQQLKQSHGLQWTFIVIHGNPKAYKIRQRFVDEDLNRVFHKVARYDEADTYELRRAKDIVKFLWGKKIDYMFDIHSASGGTNPMIICNKHLKSLYLASQINIPRVVTWLIDNVVWTSLLKHFENTVKLWCLAFECGWHRERKSWITWKRIVDALIDFHKKDRDSAHRKVFPQSVVQVENLIVSTDPSFQFSKNYRWFEIIKKWEIRWKETGKLHICDEEKIIILPNHSFHLTLQKQQSVWVAYFGTLLQNMNDVCCSEFI